MINVTKTYLPPLEEYNNYLKKIWGNNHVTNFGPLSIELEEKLKKYLGVKHLFFVTNGTIALQIAIKALELKDEVITTPFSYVATTSSIVWEGCEPIFADIDPETLTIDPAEIEKKITSKTTGILATHVYGNPCHIEKIEEIAKKNNLKVIYDAAHAFGVEYENKSIFNYGDISVVSFHATKLFHTIEGGALITNDDDLAKKIGYLRNFGHSSKEKPEELACVGINGKSSEFQSAMGLCVLPKVPELIASRKKIFNYYDENLDFNILKKPKLNKSLIYNYSYYPVILPSEAILLKVMEELKKESIFPRRYFFPSLNKLNYIKEQNMPTSEDISKRIICLPLYFDLKIEEVKKIIGIINKTINT